MSECDSPRTLSLDLSLFTTVYKLVADRLRVNITYLLRTFLTKMCFGKVINIRVAIPS